MRETIVMYFIVAINFTGLFTWSWCDFKDAKMGEWPEMKIRS